jgi:hypothetical protein
VNDAEQALRATSQARDLCLSLQRAFVGPRVLEQLRADQAARLSPTELRLGLGLAWAAGDLPLLRAALASLPADRVAGDPALLAFLDVTRWREDSSG